MTVGLTKFRNDQAFENLRKHVGRRIGVLSIEEMHKAITESPKSSKCIIFRVQHV